MINFINKILIAYSKQRRNNWLRDLKLKIGYSLWNVEGSIQSLTEAKDWSVFQNDKDKQSLNESIERKKKIFNALKVLSHEIQLNDFDDIEL